MLNFSLAIALAVLAIPRAAPAQQDDGLTCVYRSAEPAEIMMMLEARMGGSVNANEALTRAERNVREQVRICTTRHSLSPDQVRASVLYAGGRASYEAAHRSLISFGVDPTIVTEAAGRLNASDREAILGGNLEVAAAIVFPLLDASGFRATGEDHASAVGAMLGQAIAGLVIQDQATMQFRLR